MELLSLEAYEVILLFYICVAFVAIIEWYLLPYAYNLWIRWNTPPDTDAPLPQKYVDKYKHL